MSKSKTLNWNDRFALLDHFQPDDNMACTALGVTESELTTARSMRKAGAFSPTTNMDVESYSKMFSADGSSTSTVKTKTAKSSTSTSTGANVKPETATKKVKVPLKRGRKGDNIANAFSAIPLKPTPVLAFAESKGVSLAVLRQSKRFDVKPELGTVHVKKDKTSKTLMIWRDTPAQK